MFNDAQHHTFLWKINHFSTAQVEGWPGNQDNVSTLCPYDLTLDDDNYGGDHWKTFKWSITDCHHSNDNNAEMTAASHNNIINFIIVFVAIDISIIISTLN